MKDANAYVHHIQALITLNHPVVHWDVVREVANKDMGLLRYRLTLRDGGLLEMFELFRIAGDKVAVLKYSFHWQDGEGHMRKRWDNATHHPEIATHPYHVHEGAKGKVLPCRVMHA